MTALQLVDDAAPGRVLVVGTLPPEGRDLDVLAPKSSVAAIERALRDNGFAQRRTTWARFAPLELVDLRVLADEPALDRATPLAGCRNACRPDASFDRPRPATTPAARVARRARRMREAGVVSLSGLDGAGKSTQAEALRDLLVAVGFDAAIEWNRLSHDRWLDAVARPVKRVLGRGGPRAVAGQGTPSGGGLGHGGAWVVIVALANALSHLRSVARHTAAGRIVICDRYVLDSVVHLRTHYPRGLGQSIAVAVVRLLSPRPRAAFYLDLPAEAAYERKPREGRLGTLERQAAAYRAECDRLRVTRLDAIRPPEDIAAGIAREAWRRL